MSTDADIAALLNAIETRYEVEFTPEVRLAIEARAYLEKMGLHFDNEALLRSVLREGFSSDSAFRGVGAQLTDRTRRTMLPPRPTAEETAVPGEVAECLDLAARICRHFSLTQYVTHNRTVTIRKGHLGQDPILFAIARLSPEILTSNLSPSDTAEWIRKTAVGVANRALSSRVSPSTMYDLRSVEDVRAFLAKRGFLNGWFLRTFLARSVVTDGERYVYMAVSESDSVEEVVGDAPIQESSGAHASFCFIGVPDVVNCPDWGELTPPVGILRAACEEGEGGLTRFHLDLDPRSAQEAQVSGTMQITFSERLTVEEYIVAGVNAPGFSKT